MKSIVAAPAAVMFHAMFAMHFGSTAEAQGGERICGDTPVIALIGGVETVDDTEGGRLWGNCAERTYGKEWNDPKLAKNKRRQCESRQNYANAQVCRFGPTGWGRECYYEAIPCRRPGSTEEPIDPCSTTTSIGRDDPIRPRLANTIDLRNITACSGSLVTFEGHTASQKALVLTAGHCIGKGSAGGYPGPGEVFKNQKMDGTFLTIRTLGREHQGACIGLNALLYATMTDTDIALYELTETYQDLAQRIGAVPFWVSRDPVAPGTKLRAPSGHHEDDLACTFSADVGNVKEHVWSWGPMMRLAGCTLKPGSSGSPLISETDGRVVGVASTTYEETNEPCSLHNPCEVDTSGQTSVRSKDTPYGHYAHRLAACVSASGQLDLSLATCVLPR
jgi:hypothetical protein